MVRSIRHRLFKKQFSLRALMALVTVICIALGGHVVWRRYQQRFEIAKEMLKQSDAPVGIGGFSGFRELWITPKENRRTTLSVADVDLVNRMKPAEIVFLHAVYMDKDVMLQLFSQPSVFEIHVEDLSNRKLDDVLEATAAGAQNIVRMSLADGYFTENSVALLRKQPSLERLRLSDCSTPNREWRVSGLSRLKTLEFRSCPIDRLEVTSLPCLEVLKCRLSFGNGASELKKISISETPRLESLDLDVSYPTRRMLRSIARLPSLTELRIKAEHCIDDEEPLWFDPELPLSLEVRRMLWPSNALEELQSCPRLTDLALWLEVESGDDLSWVRKLSQLKRLDLSNCHVGSFGHPITGANLAWLDESVGLEVLWLQEQPDEEFEKRLPGTIIKYGDPYHPFE
ncbi:MAG TPA: hypothetical protein VGJ26_15950 [Pirellulales bacterium]|jgi:hypothetical protein